jgi:magnesium transporter
MLKELLKPEIKELIDKRSWNDLKNVLDTWPAPEVADLLLDIDKSDRVLLFRVLPRDLSADVFTFFDHDERDDLLREMTNQETRILLSELDPDDRTELLAELPSKATRRMLNLLNPEDLKEARQLLGYPEDSIGRLMTPDFVAARPDWTVAKTLEQIRRFGKDSETINRIYIIDKSGKLLDDIMLRYIILSDADKKISELMDYNVVSVSAFDDQEEAVRSMERYDIGALPVVDSQEQLVGIVTFDDVIDVQAEEATEDFQKTSAINPVDQSYMSAGIFKLWWKRIPWLFVLLIANSITAGFMSNFEEALQAQLALIYFIPLLIGTAGNSGTQSATLVIRSIALGSLQLKDWWRVLKKELTVGLLLGIVLGMLTFLGGYIHKDGSVNLAIVISLSILVMILWANIIGSLLPLILEKLGLDPAVISSPFIATLIDVTGLLIYFNIAIWWFEI